MQTREAAYAGQFYPGQPEELRKEVQSFLLSPKSLLEAKGILVPHAGYIYSGAVAGRVFSSVKLPNRFILLGPNHTGWGAGLALSPSGAWQTPLGIVPVDPELNLKLLSACPQLQEDPSAHRNEHCLEVQIPFLQILKPESSFSAICVRTADFATLESLGHAMAQVIRAAAEPVLMIASSDMTHYENADAAAKQDRLAIDRMLELDPAGLYQVILENDITMCGFAPAVAVLVACADLGASSGTLIQYTHSGVVSGDYHRVVAYAGLALV
jgi:AmmeMemoRadiSam system protein B